MYPIALLIAAQNHLIEGSASSIDTHKLCKELQKISKEITGKSQQRFSYISGWLSSMLLVKYCLPKPQPRIASQEEIIAELRDLGMQEEKKQQSQ
jgi:hypothetical protein